MRRNARDDAVKALAWTALAILTAISAVAIILIGIRRANAPTYNASTGCMTSRPTKITDLILDLSDGFSSEQKKSYSDLITNVMHDLDPQEQLNIYKIAVGSGSASTPSFTVCGDDPSNMSSTDRKARQVLQNSMQTALLSLPTSSRPASPIFQLVKSIDQKLPDESKIKHKLIVVSDLVQNDSDQTTPCRQPTDYATWAASPGGEVWVPHNMSGVDITVYYVQRLQGTQESLFPQCKSNPPQTLSHRRFWTDFFSKASGINVEPIDWTER